jgi:hypothetical protein
MGIPNVRYRINIPLIKAMINKFYLLPDRLRDAVFDELE